MFLPKFFTQNAKTFQCPKCRAKVKPAERNAIELAIRQRPEMKQPSLMVTIECPRCGAQAGLSLETAILWPEIVNWALRMASPARPTADSALGIASTNLQISMIAEGDGWLFRVIGGYRRSSVVHLMVRRIPLQVAGLDGRAWDGILRIKDGLGEIIAEDDPQHLPHDQWANFLEIKENSEFRMTGSVWKKLSHSSLRKIVSAGTLRGRVT